MTKHKHRPKKPKLVVGLRPGEALCLLKDQGRRLLELYEQNKSQGVEIASLRQDRIQFLNYCRGLLNLKPIDSCAKPEVIKLATDDIPAQLAAALERHERRQAPPSACMCDDDIDDSPSRRLVPKHSDPNQPRRHYIS